MDKDAIIPVDEQSRRDRGKARRRQALLDAARAMIRESETTGFAMRALAQRAGVGEVTPYNLFGSKRGVLEAIIAAEQDHYQDEMARMEADDALDALFRIVAANVDMYRRDPKLYRVVLRDLMLTGDPSLRTLFSVPKRRIFVAWVEDAIDSGLLSNAIEPRLVTRTLSRIFVSAIGDWVWEEDVTLDSMEANVGLGFAMILRGVATPAAAARCDAQMAHYQSEVNRHSRRRAAEPAT